MHSVSFHSTWGVSSGDFLKAIIGQTPAKSGTWNDIEGVADPERAEYHVVFNKPWTDITEERTLLFSAEPPVSSNYGKWNTIDAAEKFPIESYYKPQF